MRSLGSASPGRNATVARPVVRFTVAATTPATPAKAASTWAAHEAQVIPLMARVSVSTGTS